jgi:hypothetical protein
MIGDHAIAERRVDRRDRVDLVDRRVTVDRHQRALDAHAGVDVLPRER